MEWQVGLENVIAKSDVDGRCAVAAAIEIKITKVQPVFFEKTPVAFCHNPRLRIVQAKVLLEIDSGTEGPTGSVEANLRIQIGKKGTDVDSEALAHRPAVPFGISLSIGGSNSK